MIRRRKFGTNPPGKKMLDPATLERVATRVAEMARSQGVFAAVLGGLAMQRYGSDRLTGDVDFVADEQLEPAREMTELGTLSFGGTQYELDGVAVDVIVRDDDDAPLYEAALSASRIDGGLRVVSPEYLAIIKMSAGREKDLGDLDFLLTNGVGDVDAMRKIAREFLGAYGLREFDAVTEEVAWRLSKGKK